MNAETDAFYGRDTPSKTYKWGLALPEACLGPTPGQRWRIVCWFPSRKNAEAYAGRVHGRGPHAIARANLADYKRAQYGRRDPFYAPPAHCSF